MQIKRQDKFDRKIRKVRVVSFKFRTSLRWFDILWDVIFVAGNPSFFVSLFVALSLSFCWVCLSPVSLCYILCPLRFFPPKRRRVLRLLFSFLPDSAPWRLCAILCIFKWMIQQARYNLPPPSTSQPMLFNVVLLFCRTKRLFLLLSTKVRLVFLSFGPRLNIVITKGIEKQHNKHGRTKIWEKNRVILMWKENKKSKEF